MNMERRVAAQPPVYNVVRPRTILYAAIIAAVSAVMAYALATRSTLDINVLHDRNPLVTRMSDGGVRNGYTVRLLNKRPDERSLEIVVEGVPKASVQVVNVAPAADGRNLVSVGPDQTRELRVLVSVPRDAIPAAALDVVFRTTDPASGETAMARDHFMPR
jgi:polyferredoxin